MKKCNKYKLKTNLKNNITKHKNKIKESGKHGRSLDAGLNSVRPKKLFYVSDFSLSLLNKASN